MDFLYMFNLYRDPIVEVGSGYHPIINGRAYTKCPVGYRDWLLETLLLSARRFSFECISFLNSNKFPCRSQLLDPQLSCG